MSSGAEDGDRADRTSSVERSPTTAGPADDAVSQTKSNAKDPARPRRKKARRACFACQRAHLTCGDERPCLRCIKRGLQDQCHDGVRKKAKYLHDAPAEALMPGFTGNYHISGPQAPPGSSAGIPSSQASGGYFSPGASTSYRPMGSLNQAGHMDRAMLNSAGAASMVTDFSGQSDGSPPRYLLASGGQLSPGSELPSTINPATTVSNAGSTNFDTSSSFFDANDPALFNFNISDLNFGNHYGALEFGMLGHISGAVGTPDVDPVNTTMQQNGPAFDGSNNFKHFGFGQHVASWQSVPNSVSRQNSNAVAWNNQGGGMDAFAIGEQSSLPGQSPHSQQGYMSPEMSFAQPEQHSNPQELLRQSISHAHQQQHHHQQPQHHSQQPQPQRQPAQFPSGSFQDDSRRRRRQTSEIYSSVTAPYSYTQGFHSLIACLNKRFPQRKVMRIAKALADIRPSFISCNQNLNQDDLIFMEKCFQRTLYEYESFFGRYGTPSIICRRTGEIAAVSKEFCLVTGWRRDILLGREPNLNVNTAGSSGPNSGIQTGASTRGHVTPRNPNVEVDPGRPQFVFLAELLDEDSVVQFYEDFANLAFGASRTSIIGTPCSLVKYRTKDDLGWTAGADNTRPKPEHALSRGDSGAPALGERDGRVECSMCWTVKRDPFDIPMFVIMNFLPII